ncbi:hypothetical protein [Streptomyces sp. ISL-86]|uniref:hypothetical protein n=1 Tax=Streptomyces sp. ISL-86 TaxID=2819187 RepID=UPI001BE8BD46|nr:hypothetical protein [Streptomyces sp. ISL-86]MBT2453633.1 hypothetical protein [Streptomyces sp. ISL-86]
MMDDHKNPPGAASEASGLGEGSEEQALRSLFSGAVQGLEPAEGALERLRYAVPARRARNRRVLVGAAAVALLAGTSIPAAMHMTAAEGSPTDHSAMAGHGQDQGGKAGGTSDPHQNGSGGPHPTLTRTPGKGQESAGAQPAPRASGSPSGGAVAGPSSTPAGGRPVPPPAAPGVPGCGAAQLGVQGSAHAPEADGKVYGSFKITNVSGKGCKITGPDHVTAAAAPGAVSGSGPAVSVVGHTAGDPASGLLPDPSAEAPVLMLQPNAAYEVQFAWVPSAESCTATPADPGTKPPADATSDSSGTTQDGAGGAATGTESQTGGPSPDPNGVAVSHTPLTGAPTTQATIPTACGGTVYRTGVIPLEAPKP